MDTHGKIPIGNSLMWEVVSAYFQLRLYSVLVCGESASQGDQTSSPDAWCMTASSSLTWSKPREKLELSWNTDCSSEGQPWNHLDIKCLLQLQGAVGTKRPPLSSFSVIDGSFQSIQDTLKGQLDLRMLVSNHKLLANTYNTIYAWVLKMSGFRC